MLTSEFLPHHPRTMYKSDMIAIVTKTLMLGVTGVGLFAWVGAAGWQDTAGLVVSILFVVLTAVQTLLAVVWWRHQRTTTLHVDGGYDLDAAKCDGNGSLVIDAKLSEDGTRHRGNGDFATTKA